MNKIQKHSLQILVEFDDFCKKHHLEYCLAWGTLLGAVRHKGFIPWDDDIDIAMDSKNWNKLKELVKQGYLPSHFRFEDTGYKKGAKVPKIRDLRYDDVIDDTGRVGYFLDIFPFRHYSSVDKAIIQFCSYGYHLRNRRFGIKNRFLRSIYGILTLLPHEISKLIRLLVFPFIEKKAERPSDKYFDKYLVLQPKEWFELQDFSPFVMMDFEGYQFPVPLHWDLVLKTRYGDDYMIPKQCENALHYRPNKKSLDN